MTVLEVENLKVSYSNHTALENINLKINEGDYVCLVGENGSGKSTLVKTIVGLLKPDEGNVFSDEFKRFRFSCYSKRNNNVRNTKTWQISILY